MLIDLNSYIYSNTPERINLAGVINYGISDHHLTFISLKKNIEKKKKVSFSCRNLTNYTPELLRLNLENVNRNNFYPTECSVGLSV